MAKEYELTAFDTGKDPYVDGHGNTWCTAVFLGEGEPVKWVVKDPTAIKVGERYYGSIIEQTSKANKTYLRFKREQRPDGAVSPENNKPTEEYWENKQSQIKAQWAIGQSVQLVLPYLKEGTKPFMEAVESQAKELYAMVDRVANPEEVDENDRDIINLGDLPL